VRKLRWSRIGATLLAFVVGLTLTLVCQGHDRGNEHTGPHLTFLGGPQHNHNLDDQGASLDNTRDSAAPDQIGLLDMSMPGMDLSQPDMSLMDMAGMDMQVNNQLPTPETATTTPQFNTVGPNIVSPVTTPPLESTNFATLSFLLLLPLLRRGLNLRPLDIAVAARRKSQTGTTPEPPPPRPQ